MPTYVYSCPEKHSFEKYKATPYQRVRRYKCPKCGLWATRDYVAEHATGKKTVHLDYSEDPISHLVKKRSFKGIWTENLTPEPVLIKNERQYQRLLEQTNSREKGR